MLNSGTEAINLPDESIPVARFKVSCADNVFYDLSNGDLAITGSATADVSCKTVVPQSEEHSAETIVTDGSGSPGNGSGGGNGDGEPSRDTGSFDLLLACLLLPLLVLRRRLRA